MYSKNIVNYSKRYAIVRIHGITDSISKIDLVSGVL